MKVHRIMASALVFIHGWASTPEIWRGQEEHFASRNVVLPDIGSAGDIRQAAEYIAASIKDVAEYVLIGWSLGWLAVLEALRSLTVRPIGLVSVCSTPKFVDDGYLGAGPTRIHLAKMIRDCKRDPARAVGAFYETALPDVEEMPIMDLSYDNLLPGLGMLESGDYRGFLEQIHMPALIVAGGRDTICPKEASEYMHHRIPGSRLEVLDCCHAPFLSKLSEFNAVLESFVRSL